jgi:RNA polymerase sigma-70 factor (ECF subfamily)
MEFNFESIYQETAGPLRSFILRRTGDAAAADDILQEVFLRVHSRIGTLREESKLQSWIYQIARNAINDHFRRSADTVELPETLPAADEAEQPGAAGELAAAVKTMLSCLPEKSRQALILSEYRGLTQIEIARRLGLSLSGAKSRVQRARSQLKDLFLECCHFEFDPSGNVLDYQPRTGCCQARRC